MPELEEIADAIVQKEAPVRGQMTEDDWTALQDAPEDKAKAEPEAQPEPAEEEEPEPQRANRIKVQIPDEDGGYHEKEYEPEELAKRHANATARIRELQRLLEQGAQRYGDDQENAVAKPKPEQVQASARAYEAIVPRAQVDAWQKSYEEQGYDADEARRYAEYWANQRAQEVLERQRQEQTLQGIRQEMEQFKQERQLMAITASLQRERPDFQPFVENSGMTELRPEFQEIIDEYGPMNLKQLYGFWNLSHPKGNPKAAVAEKSRQMPTIGGGGAVRKSTPMATDAEAQRMARMFFPEEHEKADREKYLQMVAAQRKGQK